MFGQNYITTHEMYTIVGTQIDIKLTRCKVLPIELQHNNILPHSLTLALVQLFLNDQFRWLVTY
jgi:hypothetical protein